MDDGERIVSLEVKVAFLSMQISETNKAMSDMRETVHELRDMLVAARGMRWLLLGLIALAPILTSIVGWFAFLKPAIGK